MNPSTPAPAIRRGPQPADPGGKLPLGPLVPLLSGPMIDQLRRVLPRSVDTLDPRESRLSRSGQPVEAAFVWPSSSLRVTVDPAPQETSEGRLTACRRWIDWAPTPSQREVLRHRDTWASRLPLRYGAWLGLRDHGHGPRGKLYLEIPDGVAGPTMKGLTSAFSQATHHRQVEPCMLGLSDDGGIEVYCAVDRLARADLDRLLDHLSLPPHGARAIHLLERLWRCRIGRTLPSFDLGFSVALDDGGHPTAFTLYSVAEALLGDDSQIRRAILKLAFDEAWNATDYARLSRPLRRSRGGDSYHGMVGVVVSRAPEVLFTATIAPTEDAS